MLSLNTHDYDGKLPKDSDLMRIIITIRNEPLHVRKRECTKFITEIGITFHIPQGSNKYRSTDAYMKILMNSWDTSSNYDSSNGISAEEILYIISQQYFNSKLVPHDHPENVTKDLVYGFYESCSEMGSGNCPQGRVARLWQVANAYLHLLK